MVERSFLSLTVFPASITKQHLSQMLAPRPKTLISQKWANNQPWVGSSLGKGMAVPQSSVANHSPGPEAGRRIASLSLLVP